MSIPIGITTLVDLDLPIAELLARIAAAGFTFVGLSHSVDHAGFHIPECRTALSYELARSGLALDYIHPPIAAYIDLCSLDKQVRRQSIELHKFIAEACAELGGHALTIHACNEPKVPLEDVLPRARAGLEAMQELIEFGAPLGVQMCVENQPNYLDAEKVTQALIGLAADLPGFYCTLDPNHARIDNLDYLNLVKRMAPRVRATHCSDTMGLLDSHLIPGEGVVDFVAVARELGRAGFGQPTGMRDGKLVVDPPQVLNLESSLWMLRKRFAKGTPHPGDPKELPSLDDYLAACAAAARKIAADVEAAWPSS